MRKIYTNKVNRLSPVVNSRQSMLSKRYIESLLEKSHEISLNSISPEIDAPLSRAHFNQSSIFRPSQLLERKRNINQNETIMA
jgi:hypothetical protein